MLPPVTGQQTSPSSYRLPCVTDVPHENRGLEDDNRDRGRSFTLMMPRLRLNPQTMTISLLDGSELHLPLFS